MVEIEIDGKKIEVPAGTPVIAAAEKIGTYIPHFCYHKKLSIAASCRMCMVEVEKMPRPVPACATPVAPGMVVHTHGERAVAAQKAVMEFLLINHPLDCPICDQGGECLLQDIAVGYGNGESRYREEKRIVFHKNVGPLISMEEMSRCIHCTRCVRFGQEIAGVMELGMLNRGEHAEITTFLGRTVDSELSGNMIDLCPVGALTSKPFRYQARGWELSRSKSVSPHDGLGANLIVQAKNDKVLRVLPLENEAINECWLADKERFSYEALNSPERLTRPMVKQDNQWHETDWATALEYVAHALADVKQEHGSDAIAALASPHSTLEELALLQKLLRGLGSDHIDCRLRQSDFALDGKITPWLGMPIAAFGQLQDVFVIGSFLRNDHPLLAARLRQAAKRGAQVSMLHATEDDWLMPVANKMIMSPSGWLTALAEVAVAVAQAKGLTAPAGFGSVVPSATAMQIAASLLSGRRAGIFQGNTAVQHPQASQLHALAEWIAQNTAAGFGYLTEAANTVGGYLAGACGQAPLAGSRQAVVLLNAEPELDCADPLLARAVLGEAKTVIVLSAFKHSLDLADVLLPIAPFTETSGTFVNGEGRAQSFNGVVRPLGDARPGWKVLRVLGNLLELDGFDYDTSEAVRDEITHGATDLSAQLNNFAGVLPQVAASAVTGLERLADVPMYFAYPLVRRARSLQMTHDAQPPKVRLSPVLMQQLGIADGDPVRVSQTGEAVVLPVQADDRLPDGVVRVAAAHPTTSSLGPMSGAIRVEKA
ncbi:MAG: NADH-quinone oxidoreductase subunit NuoG [Burkholderiaceae bacterium]|nr:NADH-quinone oxidoreductase subunit NuoG [Burkholderiaceae bacterium]